MPHRTYMDVDPRRDHSLRVPRPDLSVSIGTPNACSGCHVADQLESIDAPVRQRLKEYADWLAAAAAGDQQVESAIKSIDQWCDNACEKWYGSDRKKPAHFAEPIVAIRTPGRDAGEQKQAIEDLLRVAVMPDEVAPAIARATALSELANAGVTGATSTAKKILDNSSEHPIVRAAAINLFMGAANADAIRKALLPHIDDESRLVRTEATRTLVASGAYGSLRGSEKTRVDLALREVRDALMSASDRAGAHMGWAMLCEGQGRYDEAIEAYETAMRVEPNMTGPRTNLASLLEGLAGRSRVAQEAAQLMGRVAQLRAAELPLLGRDASLAPDNAMIQYRYGLALYLAGKMDEAMERLDRAVELAPDASTFQQARHLLKEKLQQE